MQIGARGTRTAPGPLLKTARPVLEWRFFPHLCRSTVPAFLQQAHRSRKRIPVCTSEVLCYTRTTFWPSTSREKGELSLTTTPLDKEILHEIVRVIRAKEQVPHTVEVGGKRYALTYLDDHYQRLMDALASRDANMLSILFGQLASKVKYQVVAGPEPGVKRRATAPKKLPTQSAVQMRKRKAARGQLSTLPKARKPSTTAPKGSKVNVVSVGKLRVSGRKARPKK